MKTSSFSDKEVAVLIAGLRVLQTHDYDSLGSGIQSVATDCGRLPQPKGADIDRLCYKLNGIAGVQPCWVTGKG